MLHFIDRSTPLTTKSNKNLGIEVRWSALRRIPLNRLIYDSYLVALVQFALDPSVSKPLNRSRFVDSEAMFLTTPSKCCSGNNSIFHVLYSKQISEVFKVLFSNPYQLPEYL